MIIRTPRTFFTRFGKVVFRGGMAFFTIVYFPNAFPATFTSFAFKTAYCISTMFTFRHILT